jgi:hypothetical protein
MAWKTQSSIYFKLFFYLVSLTAILYAGIPDMSGASFDDSPYQQFLDRYVVQHQQIDHYRLNVVDYDAIFSSGDDPDSLYRKVLSLFSGADPDSLETREEKIAFWINAYNVGAIKMIMDHYPVESIRSSRISWLKNPWDKKILNVGGEDYSLGDIEHKILLGTFKEPLVHFAVVCASLSCPELSPRAYRGTHLMEHLETQARAFLNDPLKGVHIDRENGIVYFSKIFKFDQKTFPNGAEDAVPLIGRYLKDADRKYLASEDYKIRYLEYDWSLNTLKNAR